MCVQKSVACSGFCSRKARKNKKKKKNGHKLTWTVDGMRTDKHVSLKCRLGRFFLGGGDIRQRDACVKMTDSSYPVAVNRTNWSGSQRSTGTVYNLGGFTCAKWAVSLLTSRSNNNHNNHKTHTRVLEQC